ESHVDPPPCGGGLEQQESTSRREQVSHMTDDATQICGGMDDVRSQDQVELPRLEPLSCGVDLEIQHSIPDEAIRVELLAGHFEQRWREVREEVLRAIGGESL